MKTIPSLKFSSLLVALALISPQSSLRAGTFSTDFNSGLPVGAASFGNSIVSSSGGFTNSGCLQLTTNIGSQNGGFIITNDLDSGTPVVSFTASFKAYVGRGDGADGFSFNFAPDLPLGTITEEGAGTGLTVEFDTYNNGSPDTAPAIDVKVSGTEQGTTFYQGIRTAAFVDVLIQLNPDNTLSVVYDGNYIYSNLNLTAYGYTPAAGSLFGFGARTGGINERHYIDDLVITTMTNRAPFVNSMLPQFRKLSATGLIGVPNDSPIDILLTDNTTQVNTNSIVFQLDGSAVSPSITTDGSGNTTIHYSPPGVFAYSSTHSVSLSFADNATPTPNTISARSSFVIIDPPFVPGAYVTVFSDGFESYTAGNQPLDKNLAGPNAAPNGSGNPWFGPNPPNARVVGAETGVTPHSGTKMITGSAQFDGDANWYNIPYRLRGGGIIQGNCMLDWWFYDPTGAGDSGFGDYVALGFYDNVPGNTDYPDAGNLFNGFTLIQRISLGASPNKSDNPGPGSAYDSGKYQARVAIGGPFDYAYGWHNTSVSRSIGWHHGRIMAGGPLADNTAPLYFYIDDMVSPAYIQNSTTSYGFNVIEINSGTLSTLGYFDDVSFALAVPPNLSVARSGSNAMLTWPGSGWTLQSAPGLQGPWTDIAGATSPYSYDTTSNPAAVFRLKN